MKQHTSERMLKIDGELAHEQFHIYATAEQWVAFSVMLAMILPDEWRSPHTHVSENTNALMAKALPVVVKLAKIMEEISSRHDGIATLN